MVLKWHHVKTCILFRKTLCILEMYNFDITTKNNLSLYSNAYKWCKTKSVYPYINFHYKAAASEILIKLKVENCCYRGFKIDWFSEYGFIKMDYDTS